MSYRIAIADDHPIFRAGIKDVLSKSPELELVGEAGDGMEAYQMILAKLPDIMIIDLEMPLLTGLDVCKKVLTEKHVTKFIVLTMHKEKHFFTQAMETGALGYLLKDTAVNELLTCINSVAKGNTYVSAEIDNFLVERNQQQELSGDTRELLDSLTPTEKVILKLIAEGKTTSEIANMLFISPSTAENHRGNMTKKLQLEGKNSLLKFAMENNTFLKSW